MKEQFYDRKWPLQQKREYLAAELSAISKQHFGGQTPTQVQIRDHPEYTTVCLYTYNRVFGSWNQAILAAGLTPRKRGGQPGKRGPNIRTKFKAAAQS